MLILLKGFPYRPCVADELEVEVDELVEASVDELGVVVALDAPAAP